MMDVERCPWALADQVQIASSMKAFGPGQEGRPIAEVVAAGTTICDLPTPVLTLDAGAVEHNIGAMGRWTARHAVELAPHGKTTMSPALWRRQLDAGASAITVATPWQLRVAIAAGIPRIQHAGAIVDANLLAHLGRTLTTQPDLELAVWADCPRTVEIMAAAYPADAPPLSILVDRGGPGARTGARTTTDALETAIAVDHASNLTLAGVSAWEGSLQGSASAGGPDEGVTVRDAVAEFCDGVAETFEAIDAAGLLPSDQLPVITAGGSAYFDIVVERWAHLLSTPSPRARVVLRSGCYLTHDDGTYAQLSPFSRGGDEQLVAALHMWAQVVSRPEAGLALLNAGRRDVSFDWQLPVPLRVRGRDLASSAQALSSAAVTALNDQHTYLSLDPTSDLAIGDVVQFGISHPCTSFDKWSVVPVINDAHIGTPLVVGAIRTIF